MILNSSFTIHYSLFSSSASSAVKPILRESSPWRAQRAAEENIQFSIHNSLFIISDPSCSPFSCSTLSAQRRAAGQPSNDSGIEDSLSLFHSGTGTADTWNDEANSNTFVKSYVIEYNSAPTPEPGMALAGVLAGVGLLMRRKRMD